MASKKQRNRKAKNQRHNRKPSAQNNTPPKDEVQPGEDINEETQPVEEPSAVEATSEKISPEVASPQTADEPDITDTKEDTSVETDTTTSESKPFAKKQAIAGISIVTVLIVALIGWLAFSWFAPSPFLAAQIDGADNVTKREVRDWSFIVDKSRGQDVGVVDNAPEFKECIKAYQKAYKESDQPITTSQAKENCQGDYDYVQETTLSFLIRSSWTEAEAKAKGFSVTDEQVQKEFEARKKQGYPTEKDFQKFLDDSGHSKDDIIARTRLDLLNQKLEEDVLKGKKYTPSEKEIKEAYNQNKEAFLVPDRWKVEAIPVKDEKTANQVKSEWEKGANFKQLAKKHVPNITDADLKPIDIPKNPEQNVFYEDLNKSSKGDIIGPIRTYQGYAVIRNVGSGKKYQRSLAQTRSSIKKTLTDQDRQEKVTAFNQALENKWKKKTYCPSSLVVPSCRNYEAPAEEEQTNPQNMAPTNESIQPPTAP